MSNIQSYNALIDRFKAFASGHFILKTFSHGQIDTADLEKFTEYPFMHVVPSNVTYAKGTKTFSFQIVLADLPRDKDDKVEFQREVLSDLQRIAEDLVAEITNHRVLFGDLITVQNVTLEPFLEEFHNTLTGWTVSLELLVPYYWDACSIPAEWNDMFESGSGGTGSILTFIDSITRDEYGNVSLVNDEATPAPNYYYGTNDEGVRGWYLTTDNVGLTCETIGDCQTIIDIEAAIDALEEEILLKADITSISAVGFSNDYNDLDNKPTIPDVSGFVPYVGATADVDLGTHNLTADHIALNVSPSGAGYVVGATQWNNTIGSSETLLKGGSVSLKNGVDLVARVVNKVTPNTTLTKAAYQAVRVSGAQGQRLAVAFAQANNDNNSADTIGLVTETIATNQEGFILTVGQLEGINTTGSLQGETWADGDVLYLSPTTAGALTNIKPTGATGHIVVIGYVEYAHANNGKIYVKIMNGWELDELHNVYISSPANNQGLFYDSADQLWKNETIASALGYTPFNLPSLTSGSVLFSNGTTIAQDNANLFFDNTNNRLGIGTASPVSTLDVNGTARVQGVLTTTADAVVNGVNIGIGGGSISSNTRFGNGALNSNTTGSDNTAIGFQTLFDNTTGVASTAVGYFALESNTTGNSNTAVGTSSLRNLTSGLSNTAFGVNAGRYIADGTTNLTTSSTSIFIGSLTKPLANSQTNQIVIGYDAIGLGSNSVVLGNSSITLTALRGNVLINTTTDAGYKLDVNGTARVSGTTTITPATLTGTAATSALDISQTWNTTGTPSAIKLNVTDTASNGNSRLLDIQVGGVSKLIFGKNGKLFFGAFNSTSNIQGNDTSKGLIFSTSLNLVVGNGFEFANLQGSITNLSSTSNGLLIQAAGSLGFSPTSGTGLYNSIHINDRINQTGGASGITRGLYVNPTLTAVADFRAIEVASGITILGASTTAKASLRIPSGTAPTSPVNGDIWFDGTDIKMRIGGVTKTFTLI